MKLEPEVTVTCPNCKSHDSAPLNPKTAVCNQCGQRWPLGEYGSWVGRSVTVNNVMSCWHGCTGKIEEVISQHQVRVKFILNKRETGGDIFHPHYLTL